MKLVIIREKTLVYDAKIPEKNGAFRKVHNLLWNIVRDGYIDYWADQTEDHVFMYAQITRTGRNWIWKLLERVFFVLVGLATIIGVLFMIF